MLFNERVIVTFYLEPMSIRKLRNNIARDTLLRRITMNFRKIRNLRTWLSTPTTKEGMAGSILIGRDSILIKLSIDAGLIRN